MAALAATRVQPPSRPLLLLRQGRTRTRGSTLRQAFAGLWNRLSLLWKVVIVLATLGSAVAFVLLLVALVRAGPERELRVGDTAAWHGLDFSFTKIACHKRRKDLPEELPYVPIKGELCFAYFRIRNSSDDSRTTYFLLPERERSFAQLHIGDEGYEATISAPMLPGTLVPDQEEPMTFIFDIPHRVEPTALTLKDGQGDEAEWEIP
jgi:hypothetical protein